VKWFQSTRPKRDANTALKVYQMKWKPSYFIVSFLILATSLLVWAQQPVAQGPQASNAAEWLFNLTKFGGSALTLGQQTAANSMPVILPSATVTTLTPPPASTPQSTSTYAPSVFDLAATAATNVKSSAGNVYGWYGFNPNATTCFLQFYNSASATLGTSALHPFGILAGGSFNLAPGSLPLFNLSTAISTGETTTATGGTACGSAMTITILYF
jgi:hypothetical protein